jgi:hypothetical protein
MLVILALTQLWNSPCLNVYIWNWIYIETDELEIGYIFETDICEHEYIEVSICKLVTAYYGRPWRYINVYNLSILVNASYISFDPVMKQSLLMLSFIFVIVCAHGIFEWTRVWVLDASLFLSFVYEHAISFINLVKFIIKCHGQYHRNCS